MQREHPWFNSQYHDKIQSWWVVVRMMDLTMECKSVRLAGLYVELASTRLAAGGFCKTYLAGWGRARLIIITEEIKPPFPQHAPLAYSRWTKSRGHVCEMFAVFPAPNNLPRHRKPKERRNVNKTQLSVSSDFPPHTVFYLRSNFLPSRNTY